MLYSSSHLIHNNLVIQFDKQTASGREDGGVTTDFKMAIKQLNLSAIQQK